MAVMRSFCSTMAMAAIAFAASFVLGFPICALLRRLGVMDWPNSRSSHNNPTVRGGGTAIVVAIMLGVFFSARPTTDRISILLTAAALFLAVLSFWDDLKSLPQAIRFGGHAVAALAVLALIGWPQLKIGMSQTRIYPPWTWCGIVVMFLWLSGYTNAFNFMDGINGIAAGQAVITGLGMALLVVAAGGQWGDPAVILSLLVAGAALGFLPHNFPSARMFMGDVGSAPLGFLLSALTLRIAADYGWWLIVPLALLHANFVLDTAITLARRWVRGERWYEAHRDHFYQRLIRAGRSHAFVTGWEMGLQVLTWFLMIAYLRASVSLRLSLVLGVFAIWGAFFFYCESTFRRTRSTHTSG